MVQEVVLGLHVVVVVRSWRLQFPFPNLDLVQFVFKISATGSDVIVGNQIPV